MSKQTKQSFQEQNSTGDSRIVLKNFGTILQTIQGPPPVHLLLGKQKPKSYASAETCL